MLRAALLLALLVLPLSGAADEGTPVPSPSSEQVLYWYLCEDVRVVDGDTVECAAIQLGFDLTLGKKTFRLWGINAPETRGPERPEGLVTKAWLDERIGGRTIVIHTIKDRAGKFGRILAEVFEDGVNLNAEMVRLGLAEVKFY